MKRFFVGLVMALFFAGDVLSAVKVVDKTPAADKTLADKVLVTVNGEPIFVSELDKFLEKFKKIKSQLSPDQLRDLIKKQLIMDVVLKQEATKQKIRATDRETKDKINEMKKGYKQSELKKNNTTLSDPEKKIADKIIITKFMQRLRDTADSETKKPSEIEAKSFYDEMVTKMKGGKTNLPKEEETLAEGIANVFKERVELIGIFISCPKGASKAKEKEAQDKIAAVKKELKNKKPEEFDDVAVSKSRNEDIGLFAGSFVEEELLSAAMRKIVFSKNVGDYTKEPIRADDGYYFLRVQEKTAKRNITFAKVKDSIIEGLHTVRVAKKCNEYIDELISKANIKE
ncbi:hypothetical protein AGMMS49990_01540 [Endomicrobiia bacterium]|nr:hypothetical protein AGMMS49990_01540 [Endomicrobiia bacterium]